MSDVEASLDSLEGDWNNLSPLFYEFNGEGAAMTTVAGIIGNIDNFDSNEETWNSYMERFELFVECNGIPNSKKVSTLLTVVGPKTYNLLRDLCTPDKPSTKSYDDIVKIVQDHLYPKPNFIAERYKFSQRDQREHESAAQYVAVLKKLSAYCEFGTNLNDYLRDRLVSGIRSESTKQKLLSEVDLTFDKAVKIIAAIEAAEKDAASLTQGGGGGYAGRLQRMGVRGSAGGGGTKCGSATSTGTSQRPQHQGPSSVNKCSVKCYCCGRVGHTSKECRLKGCVCHNCGKKNHIAKVCRSRELGKSPTNFQNLNNKQPNWKNNRGKKHNYVEKVKDTSPDLDEVICDVPNLFKMNENVTERVNVKPLKVNVMVEKQPVCFEIDTGAGVSVISEKFYLDHFSSTKLSPSDLTLSSYTNDPIIPLGKINVNVSYQNNVRKLDLYVIKRGAHPLMGRDWLKILNVNISFNNDSIFDMTKVESKSKVAVTRLVKEFPEVFSEKLGEYKSDPVSLKLKENAKPKYFKPRPLPYTLKAKVEAELERLVQADVLYPIDYCDWGTPIVPVLKPDGSVRICGDFKVTLNPNLEVERYPLPRIEDLFAELQKGELYSKIDLSQAYMQLKLDEPSQKLCTISTHKGLFSYRRVPYGINSAPGIFQRKIEQTLQGMTGVAVFLDDILISGPDFETHLSRLREVFQRLSKFGLTVKNEKCQFFVPKLEYLGYTIDKDGLHTSQSKVKAILEAKVPENVTEVKAFVGLVNYYAKFLPNLASVLRPLYDLLKKDVPFVFNKDCMQSFNQVKQLLTTAPVLAHYDPQAPAILTVDASSTGLGCVLSTVGKDGTERPVSYCSRTLSPTELQYSQIHREALAIVYGVKKYHQYLYGRHFTLRSDHKPLISIFGPKKGLPIFAASRLQRYALFLSGYDFSIEYVRSDKNNADALSRLPLPCKHNDVNEETLWVGTYLHCLKESSFPITCEQIRIETQKDPVLKKVFGYLMYGWPGNLSKDDGEMYAYYLRKEEMSIEQGVIMWGYKVVVPTSLRRLVLKELHSSHMGIVKMKSVARSYIWWPNLDRDIENVGNSCNSCLMERSYPLKAEIHNWHYPSKPWERLHLDYLGPFKGKMYLIVVDAHSKWLEVFETKNTSAKLAISNLRELFARFGLPEAVHSDNGPPFSSIEFKQFLMTNGIRQTTSAPYWPQSNGQAESSVKYAKNKLKCALRDNVDTNVALSRILFDYRNSVHLTTNQTPAQLMFGRNLRTRFDLLRPNIASVVKDKQEKQKLYARGSKTRVLYPNQSVLIRDYRGKDKWVEGYVIKQISAVMYLVKLQSGVIWKRHIDQLVVLERDFTADNVPAESTVVAPDIFRHPSADTPTSPRPMTSPRDGHRPPGTPSPRGARMRQSLTPTTQSPVVSAEGPGNASPDVPLSPHSQGGTIRRYPIRERKPVVKMNL